MTIFQFLDLLDCDYSNRNDYQYYIYEDVETRLAADIPAEEVQRYYGGCEIKAISFGYGCWGKTIDIFINP